MSRVRGVSWPSTKSACRWFQYHLFQGGRLSGRKGVNSSKSRKAACSVVVKTATRSPHNFPSVRSSLQMQQSHNQIGLR